MRKTRKFNLLLIIFVIVLVLGLGYAYLTTTLSINGTTDVDSNTWNVYWDNVQVNSGSVTGAQVTTSPTIDGAKTTVTFRVNLKKPGDYYEFTVDAKNDGTIDAMIETITVTEDIPDYLYYTISYEDDEEILENHLLSVNSKETYKVRVEYSTDIIAEDMPTTAQSILLSFGVTYVQADSSAQPVRMTVYTVSSETLMLGSTISDVTTYDNYQDAITAFGHSFFLKHIVSNDVITKSYVGFVYNNNVYYVQGGIDESSLDTKPVFEANKLVLLNAFESSLCHEYPRYYSCSDYSSIPIYVKLDMDSEVFAADEGYVCVVYNNGQSFCGRD